jgi:hypothetical protein
MASSIFSKKGMATSDSSQPFFFGHQVVKSHHRKTNPTKIDHTYPISIPNKLKIVKEDQLEDLLNAINLEQNLWN